MMRRWKLGLVGAAILGAVAGVAAAQIPTISPGTLVTAAMWNAIVNGINAVTALTPSTEYNAGNSSTAITLNFATNGPLQKVTRTGSATYTLTHPTNPGTVVVRFVHEASGTAYTVTFSPTVKFPNGTAPTWTNTSGAIDIVTLYWDGTTFYAVQTPNFS